MRKDFGPNHTGRLLDRQLRGLRPTKQSTTEVNQPWQAGQQFLTEIHEILTKSTYSARFLQSDAQTGASGTDILS